MQPPNSTHLKAAEGWLELGNYQEAFDELDEIDLELHVHPDVLEMRLRIYEMTEKSDSCIEIGNTLVEIRSSELSCWIRRSYALHRLKRTQEAYDKLMPTLDTFKGEWLHLYNLACYTCVLGNVKEARELIEEAIELGGNVVRLRALDDEHLIRVWAGP